MTTKTQWLTDKQQSKLIELLKDGVNVYDAMVKAAPHLVDGLTRKQAMARFHSVICKNYPDVDSVRKKQRKKGVHVKKPSSCIVKENKNISSKDDPLLLIKKSLSISDSPPESTDVFNLGRAMLLLAFTEIEARRNAIAESGISPLSKEGSIFSYTIVPVIKAAVEMMLPFVRDKQSNLSDSIMAAEIIKRSIEGFKENPDDYTAPIPDGVEVNDK